ncbi:hypothetical protein UlMin_010826 [Ulmus minor]
MAEGSFVDLAGGRNYEGGVTVFVVVSCMVAAMDGLIFGYDVGISGVTSMEQFLTKFFPSVHERMKNASVHENVYCKFDSHILTLFTSSPYVSASAASFFASSITRVYGRQPTMLLGGLVFFVGSILNGVANNIILLITGRLVLGLGVGFSYQSIPVYLSEMAPEKIRGALNIGFQMAISIGIFVANIVNYGTSKIKGGWGWRVSLALAAVPAVMIGKPEKAKKMLQRIGGTVNVQEEFEDILEASEAATKVEYPWRNILHPKYRPHLVICTFVPFFKQLTGVNVIMFYAPVLFLILGFGKQASLMSAAITGAVNVLATLVSIFAVDRFGRKILFLQGGFQMFVCQHEVWSGWSRNIDKDRSRPCNVLDLHLYLAAYAWSWGPLGWLVPSEICPVLEIRSAGQAMNVSVNMFFTFFIAQGFLYMLCHLKYGLFYFFSGFLAIMTVFVALFVPETKCVPIEEMNRVWKAHWF